MKAQRYREASIRPRAMRIGFHTEIDYVCLACLAIVTDLNAGCLYCQRKKVNERERLQAFLEVAPLVWTESGLRAQLVARGVERTSHLQPLFPLDFETGLMDPNSWLSGVFREAVEWKFITEHERVGLLQGTLVELPID